MVLDPIPQSLPVHFFGSRPQPPTSLLPSISQTVSSCKRFIHLSFFLVYKNTWTPILPYIYYNHRALAKGMCTYVFFWENTLEKTLPRLLISASRCKIYIHLHIYVHVYMYIHIYVHISCYIYGGKYMDIWRYNHGFTYVYVHIYICICTYIHMYIHIHIHM